MTPQPAEPATPAPKRIWIVAGEASGDTRASELMRALLDAAPGTRFVGAGGPKMRAFAGEPFDDWIAEAGVLGLWDVLKNYGYFRRKFGAMLAKIAREGPDAVVLVDYPGFNLRLARALRARFPALKIIYYISPQVWAWNRGRIPKMARWLDLILCIFPFEKSLYEASGLASEFVGHPIVEQLERERTGAPRDAGLVGLFPGSREREVRRIFPAMLSAVAAIRRSRPEIRFEAAAATEAHAAAMRELADAAQTAGGPHVEVRSGSAHELMQRAEVGVVCSGTATLEAACFGLPYCLVYKIAWLTYEVGLRLVKVPYLGIVNILAGRPVVRELIQSHATGPAIADEVLRLLNDPAAARKVREDLAAAVSLLGGPGASARAAHAILRALGN